MTKQTIDAHTCQLSDFEGMAWGEIPPEGQTRLFCAYQDYFDGLNDARKRAIGYCVIIGGISPRKIGTLDAVLCRDPNGRYAWGIAQNGHVCLLDDARLMGALESYIRSDSRLCEKWATVKPGERATAPLFIPLLNGRHERLHDCLYFMWNASKSVGFDARRICLNRMNDNPIRPLPWLTDDPRIDHILVASADGVKPAAVFDTSFEP